mmetsp:Transcript_34644/g.62843  ORF Transcript_34644/g.62843 Transcript_34644/m.62843 type:complete len:289 (+) Transcript_34644:32-898(+)
MLPWRTLQLQLLFFRGTAAKFCTLPIGDSIAQADSAHASWRVPLWKHLVDYYEDSAEVLFTGSMVNHFGEEPGTVHPQADYKQKRFPPNHEGHWGWEANQILDGCSTCQDESSGSGNIDQWLEEYDKICIPDCVLINLGTNDMARGDAAENVVAELGDIMNRVRRKFTGSDLTFLIATFRYSSLVSALWKAFGTEEMAYARVHVVDLQTGFHKGLTSDGLHPNAYGENWMADRWFEAVLRHCIKDENATFVKRYVPGGEVSASKRSPAWHIWILPVTLITALIPCFRM